MAAYDSLRSITKDSTPIERATALAQAKAETTGEQDEFELLSMLKRRKESMDSEQMRLRALFLRMDNLYYPQTITTPGGADHWPVANPASGTVHVSVNNIAPYVDIPARLQSITPVENYVPVDDSDAARDKAQAAERLYFAWKDEEEFELKYNLANTVKELYGITYGRVYWNAQEKRPSVQVIERPENLYVGWGASDFSRMDWATYCYGLTPQSVVEEFGLFVVPIEANRGVYVPYVTGDSTDPIATMSQNSYVPGRPRSMYEESQIEVYDYWYKKPTGAGKQPEIWNATFVGNKLVTDARHREFDEIPYVPLANGRLPGSPYGRPALYDLEQLFREVDERVSNAGAMLGSVVGGQMWQLTGSEAPEEVPAGAIPKPNKVAAPGPNARLEAIQPFVPQFAIADYIKEIKDFIIEASGLGDVLLGKTPSRLVSSKALSALISTYASRMGLKRDLTYQWRRRMWKIAGTCWERKDATIKKLLDGNYRLDIIPPDLSPRDELENAQKAINLGQNRYWSMRRVMGATGVDDPEGEIALIREEQSDAALNPQAVQAQLTLAAAAAQFGQQGQPGQPPGTNPANGPTPAAGGPSLNGPENKANPPASSVPTNAQAPNGAKVQTLVQGGEATGRVLTSQPI